MTKARPGSRKRSGGGKPLRIHDTRISPGETKDIKIAIARLYDYTSLEIPVRVVSGAEAGPVLFACAAIHGDEINGVEIIKRVLHHPALKKIRGTFIAVPIVNVFGFNNRSRYLPDRRDLNRSFPGSADGSLAARMAHVFVTEIVSKCTHGIDLHTGSTHRINLPQVRANLDETETLRLAKAFGTNVIINASLRDGSLRQAAADLGIPLLVYEGGEALRFDENAIRRGVIGVLSVMKAAGMFPAHESLPKKKKHRTFIAKSSHWVRAPHSGTLRAAANLGDFVRKDQPLGVLSDPFGETTYTVHAHKSGVVIGRTNLPLINRGDALFHIATFDQMDPSDPDVPFNEIDLGGFDNPVTI